MRQCVAEKMKTSPDFILEVSRGAPSCTPVIHRIQTFLKLRRFAPRSRWRASISAVQNVTANSVGLTLPRNPGNQIHIIKYERINKKFFFKNRYFAFDVHKEKCVSRSKEINFAPDRLNVFTFVRSQRKSIDDKSKSEGELVVAGMSDNCRMKTSATSEIGGFESSKTILAKPSDSEHGYSRYLFISIPQILQSSAVLHFTPSA